MASTFHTIYLTVIAATLSSAAASHGATYNWSGTSSNQWNDPANWTPGVVPGFQDDARITDAGNRSVMDLGAGAAAYRFAIAPTKSGYIFGAGAIGSQTVGIYASSQLPGYLLDHSKASGSVQVNANVKLRTTAATYWWFISNNPDSPTGSTFKINGTISTDVGDVPQGTTGGVRLNASKPIEIHGIVSDSGNIKLGISSEGAGGTTLFGQNTYRGGTSISNSTLRMGAANVIPDEGVVTLVTGGLDTIDLYTATIATNGFDDIMGALAIVQKGIIDFGNGDSDLWFADSSDQSWFQGHPRLDLINFNVGIDSLRFGTNSAGLTDFQLKAIRLNGYNVAGLDENGYVTFVSVPEPTALWLTLISLGSLAVFRRRLMRF
jgi:hypothetical protein